MLPASNLNINTQSYPPVLSVLDNKCINDITAYAKTQGALGDMHAIVNSRMPYKNYERNTDEFISQTKLKAPGNKGGEFLTPAETEKIGSSYSAYRSAKEQHARLIDLLQSENEDKTKDVQSQVTSITFKRNPYINSENAEPDIPLEERVQNDMVFKLDHNRRTFVINKDTNISQQEVDEIMASDAQKEFDTRIQNIEAQIRELNFAQIAANLDKNVDDVYKVATPKIVQAMTDFLYQKGQSADLYMQFTKVSTGHTHIIGLKEIDFKTKEAQTLVEPIIGAAIDSNGELVAFNQAQFFKDRGANNKQIYVMCFGVNRNFECRNTNFNHAEAPFTLENIRRDPNITTILPPTPSASVRLTTTRALNPQLAAMVAPARIMRGEPLNQQEPDINISGLFTEQKEPLGRNKSWWQLPATVASSLGIAGLAGYYAGSKKRDEKPRLIKHIVNRLELSEDYIKSGLKKSVLNNIAVLYDLSESELKTLADILYPVSNTREAQESIHHEAVYNEVTQEIEPLRDASDALNTNPVSRIPVTNEIDPAEKHRIDTFFTALEALQLQKSQPQEGFLSRLKSSFYSPRAQYAQPQHQNEEVAQQTTAQQTTQSASIA